MFAEAVEDILRDRCTPVAVRSVEAGDDARPLWSALVEPGFLDLLLAEDQGGAGLPLNELFPVLECLGRFAAPLPWGQSIVARAIVGPGVTLPKGMLTLAPSVRREPDGVLVCADVPFAMTAEHVLAADGDGLFLLPCEGAQRSPSGDPRSGSGTLRWARQAAQPLEADASRLQPFAAALHAALIVGAMQRVLDMSLRYADERSQFGRTLGKFQVIQHQLSVMAERVAVCSMAAQTAFQTAEKVPARVHAAMAKARASEAAVEVADAAHALHGAIGVTEAFDLQLYTRRLHQWRMDHGSERYWHRLVGDEVLASGLSMFEFARVR